MKRLLPLLLSLYALVSNAGMSIVQIGGGNKIDNSQGQIEDNVIWLNEILRKTGNGVQNYYASGTGDEKDVGLFVEDDRPKSMLPIGRVFGDPVDERIFYRHNRVDDLAGSMNKDDIVKSLSETLSGLAQNQQFLLIYNGHGGKDDVDVRDNYLKIWGEEKLTVSEVDKLFDMAPESTTVRYVFPQCYSGAFYRLVYEDPYSDKFGKQMRCGFFSETPYDQSEGCSLSTNREEYRDYSTYFFAPLNGRTRNEEPLPIDPDLDGNGIISFAESHLYAIKAGTSKDLSRSTSEVFLENWAPWYLRWAGRKYDMESQYWGIADFLAKRESLDLDDRSLGMHRKQVNEELDKLNDDLENCESSADSVAEQLRKELIKRWPELMHPYTSRYIEVVEQNLEEIVKRLNNDDEYKKLVEYQEECKKTNDEILTTERKLAQIEKILRYKNLAMLEYYFKRYAGEGEQSHYGSLLKCEGGAFFTEDAMQLH